MMNQTIQTKMGTEVASNPQSTQQGDDAPGAVLTRGNAMLPPVDIFEDNAGLTILADLPGVSKESLGVRIDHDNLVIEGTASAPVGAEAQVVYGEIQNPWYYRSFTLSRDLDAGKIEAKLSDGVLTLRIPKVEEAKPRRIEVSVV
jgi:HSP20 family protein